MAPESEPAREVVIVVGPRSVAFVSVVATLLIRLAFGGVAAVQASEHCVLGKAALPKALKKISPPQKGDDAHHIVAQAAPEAVHARQVLKEVGICINDAANGVFIPKPLHIWIHNCDDYYGEVDRRLENLQSRDKVLVVLGELRDEILAATKLKACGRFGSPKSKSKRTAASFSE